MNTKDAKKVPKKKINGYQMPEPIKNGEILTDMKKKQWIIGSSIGIGGFGEIYAAAPYSGKTPKEYPAVIKIEPHGNGPLFVEMHFYMRNANPEEVDTWRKKKKIANLGMPKFLGSGSHEYNNTKYRFLVVERYGTDLWKLFLENGRKFPEHTVYKVAIQVIDVLEYIHYKKYIHGDIKGGNLLLHIKFPNWVYLVDFGLACHYTTKLEYTPDPKKAHDGTTEYTSRDAHMGVATMRGDLEILGYNIIQWLCGTLPWEKSIKEPVTVQKQKEQAFKNLSKFLNQCFDNMVPAPVTQFMTLLDTIKFNETPNYDKIRDIFVKGLRQLGHTSDGQLEFKVTASTKERSTPKRAKTVVEKSRKSPRMKQNEVSEVKNSLNESFNTVLDKKFVSGSAAKDHLMASIDFESESEYNIQIKKRKKKVGTEDAALKKTEKPKKRGRQRAEQKAIEKDTESDSDVEISTNKVASKAKIKSAAKVTLRSKLIRTVKTKPKYASDSDKDMFDTE